MSKQKQKNGWFGTFSDKLGSLWIFGKRKTRKSQIKEKLRSQNEMLETIIESLTHPFFVVDTENLTVRLANTAASKMADIFGEIKCYALNWQDHKKCGTKDHLCPIDTVTVTKKSVTIEHTCRDKDGNIRYAEVNAYPVFDKNGNVSEIIEYWLDVTDRRLAEEKIESLAKFPAENPNAVIRISKDGHVLYTNTPGLDILKDWNCRVGGYIPHSWKQYIDRIMKNNKNETLEIDAPDRSYSFTFAPVAEADYINIYATDITQQKKAEDDLRRYREHLEELVAERTEELTEANKKLTEEIQNRIWLEREILNISEQEQRRIGQELHDSLGQQLIGIAFMTRVLQQKLQKKKIKETEDLSAIAKLVNEATDQARSLAKGLHPVDIDSGSLSSSLHELAVSTEKLFGIRCELNYTEALKVTDTEAAVHIYRIAQEAVTNAIKHGRTRNIRISLAKSNNKAIMIIENDGKDFPSKFEKRGAGMGLQIMDHRIDLIGGELTIRKGSKGGTVLTCTFPLALNQ
ncbi:MAG: PAS domain-containing protein [Sedimentisphaerales bacterium]|nr:PAS domain-containing protein [Sedimentisphaerales bacterium]